MYYNKEGKKIELMEWAKLLEDFDYKIIKQDNLSDGKRVSTVWLGLDQQFGKGKPLIFETMVFSKKKKTMILGRKLMMGEELNVDRYSTLEEALAGHKKMFKKYNKK